MVGSVSFVWWWNSLSSEFVRLVGCLNDLGERLTLIQVELKELRRQVNVALIEGKLEAGK